MTNHSRMSTRSKPGHEALAKWAGTQRSSKSDGTLEEARRLWLDGMHGWRWIVHAFRTWDEQFDALEAFVTNRSRMPTRYDLGHEALAKWVYRQRSSNSDGTLGEARRLRLDGMHGWR